MIAFCWKELLVLEFERLLEKATVQKSLQILVSFFVLAIHNVDFTLECFYSLKLLWIPKSKPNKTADKLLTFKRKDAEPRVRNSFSKPQLFWKQTGNLLKKIRLVLTRLGGKKSWFSFKFNMDVLRFKELLHVDILSDFFASLQHSLLTKI